jgi:HlyD family secretion protein
MSKRTKLSIFGVLFLILVGTVGGVAATRGDKPIDVRVEAVEARDLVASVQASGKVQPRVMVDLSADITGRIVSLRVREGDLVQKGQLLLRIDPAQYEAAVQRAEASLASVRAQATQTQANLVQAKRDLQRAEEILKANPSSITGEQMEKLRTQAEINEAVAEASRHSVDQAVAGLRDAQNNLTKTTIFAPMSGRVTRLNVEEGETAIMGTMNKDAATLLTISDMSVLETKVRVDETDVARVTIGDSTVVQIDAFPDTTFLGRVVQISNSSVRGATGAQADQAVDYEVTIQLVDAPPATRPDFSATAKIITDSRRSVLSIPIIALTVREHEVLPDADAPAVAMGPNKTDEFAKKDAEGVFVVGADNKVTFRPVKVGIAGEKFFEVVDGLKPGEKIVAGTYQAIRELKDGALVRQMQEPASTTATATKKTS